MFAQNFSFIPPDVLKLILVLFLSFLIGLEREERKSVSGRYGFGGIRTYPLIGLLGYGLAFVSPNQAMPFAAGLLVIGGLMGLSYWHKTRTAQEAGLTSEVVGLATYLMGALVYGGHLWLASTVVITSLILLELKSALEGLAARFSPTDILTLTQFLFLTLVILPILPDRELGPFQINPFKSWLVVVAVSGVSYGSFLLQRLGKGGIPLIALLGGAYSSTVTTVALAKRSHQDRRPSLYAGSILMTSGVMYLRLTLLVSLFNPALGRSLLGVLGSLAILGIGGGWVWSRRSTAVPTPARDLTPLAPPTQNPLELRAAFLFALLFVGMIALTQYTLATLGHQGIYTLASIMGVTDIDPFVLSLTASAGPKVPLQVAGSAIVIAAASNNLVKGLYAVGFGDRATGRQSLMLLCGLAIAGLVALIWTTDPL